MLCASWQYEVIKISDAKRIGAIKKVFTGFTMQKPENDWMKQYPSTVYQSVFIDLADAFSRWRKGLSGFPKPITKKKGNSFTVTLATCSDSATYDMPVSTKKAKIKLGKLQYRDRNKVLGNKKLGVKTSNNAHKVFESVARQHARIANIRRDVIQKMTTDISRKAFIIRIENLNISGMPAKHKLSNAVSNNCLYEIRRQLTYKQYHYETKVELVDRWFPSSKTCSKCGYIQVMKLSQRIFDCEKCDHIQDRDENAAINPEVDPLDKMRLA